MNKKRNQRGYNLVEIAIVLVASLMMASWLAVNYANSQKEQRAEEARNDIRVIKERIILYAASNNSKEYQVFNQNASTSLVLELPGGRPYLPCPDVDGDGHEDRSPNLTVTVATPIVNFNETTNDYPLEDFGGCLSYKGLIPFETLDVRGTDPWGNYYTYRISPNFANSGFGFDEQTRADDGAYIRPLMATVLTTLGQTNTLILRRAHAVGSSPVDITIGSQSPGIVCVTSPCSFNSDADDILIGEIATAAITVYSGGYDIAAAVHVAFESGNVINGAPVVIVSHGQNGYGAVKAARVGTSRFITRRQCQNVPSTSEDEQQNASRIYAYGSTSNRCPLINPPGSGTSNGFVSKPSDYFDVGDGFDDIVDWMSTEEIILGVRNHRRNPIDPLPPLGLEDI